MSSLTKSRYLVVENFGEPENSEFAILFHTITRALAILPEKEWSRIAEDPSRYPDSTMIENLAAQGMLVPEGTDERKVFDAWKEQYVHDFGVIRSKVLVTRRCNFRCVYCAVDHEARDMSPQSAFMMDRFYLDLIKLKNPLRVEDEYSGGEVTLNENIVLESAQRRCFFCLGKGIDYGFSIVTNGMELKKPFVSRMKEIGLKKLRVSIAGPAEVHDRLRPSKSGGKTYGRIMENLMAVSDLVPVSIETQYDARSRDYLMIPEMLDEMKRNGIAVENISFSAIVPKRGAAPFQPTQDVAGIAIYLMREAESRGFPQFAESPSSACMADFRSRLVFDTQGALIPCPAVNDGEMSYGGPSRGMDFIAESQLLKRNFPQKCLYSCELLPVCFGGCRLQAQINTGDFNGVDCQYQALRDCLGEYLRVRAGKALRAQDLPAVSRDAA